MDSEDVVFGLNVTGDVSEDDVTTAEPVEVLQLWLPPLLLPKEVSVAAVVIGVIVNTCGLLGNVAIVASILISKKLRKAYNVCIGSLAVNDFLTIVFSHLFQMMTYGNRTWRFGYKMCVFHYFAFHQFNFSTILHILAITLYRYVVVMHPSLGRRVSTKSFVVTMVCMLHIIPSCIITLPKIAQMDKFGFVSKVALCLPVFVTENPGIPPVYMYAVICIIVTVALLFSHLRITRLIKKTEANLQAGLGSNSRTARQKKHAKVMKCMVVVFSLFIASYFPLLVTVITGELETAGSYAMTTTMCLLWLASGTNWIVYGVMDSDFRKAYKKLLCFVRSGKVGTTIQHAARSNRLTPFPETRRGMGPLPTSSVTRETPM